MTTIVLHGRLSVRVEAVCVAINGRLRMNYNDANLIGELGTDRVCGYKRGASPSSYHTKREDYEKAAHTHAKFPPQRGHHENA